MPEGACEVSTTVPLKNPIGDADIVEVPCAPGLVLTMLGFAERAKSVEAKIMNDTVTVWTIVPLVPVTVTVKSPGEALVQDSVEVPWVLIEDGVREQMRVVDGLTLEVRDTAPVNPAMGVTEIVDWPAMCEIVVIELGTAEIKMLGVDTTRLTVIV